jgi:hypothetical protein
MLSERSRILFLLVLLSVVVTAGWTTALAGGKTGSSAVSSSLAGIAKPPSVPNSGEPDVGQTPRGSHPAGATSPAWHDEGDGSTGHSADRWFRWIFRMWTIRYLGSEAAPPVRVGS